MSTDGVTQIGATALALLGAIAFAVARVALAALVLVALVVRLLLVAIVFTAAPRAAPDLHTAAPGRFPNRPSA